MSGSSPLTQGKHRYAFGDAEHPRLIPAHAGKTPCGASRRAGTPAHPRSREENDYSKSVAALTAGSSPLTRGKPCREGAPCVPEGLIPTHAGKTTSMSAPPRSHRENESSEVQYAFYTGSSPLTRGNHDEDSPRVFDVRLIPAYGGKTPRMRPRLRSASAHPRTRGENLDLIPRWGLPRGPSPLTRGKLP